MYGKCGRIYKARELFDKMHNVNNFIVFNDCRIHTKWIFWKRSIDMYAKCGRIYKAWESFDNMHDVNIVY